MPATVGVKSADVAVGGGPPARGWFALVKVGGPVQMASSGPNAVKVTVPVGAGAGAGPPVTVAASEMEPPMATVGVACVAMVAGGAGATTDDSSGEPQELVSGG